MDSSDGGLPVVPSPPFLCKSLTTPPPFFLPAPAPSSFAVCLSAPFPLPAASSQAELSPADVLSVIGGLGLATAHLVTQNWTLNNLMVGLRNLLNCTVTMFMSW